MIQTATLQFILSFNGSPCSKFGDMLSIVGATLDKHCINVTPCCSWNGMSILYSAGQKAVNTLCFFSCNTCPSKRYTGNTAAFVG